MVLTRSCFGENHRGSELDIGDGAADFVWIRSRNKAKSHWPIRYEVIVNRSLDRLVLSAVETKD